MYKLSHVFSLKVIECFTVTIACMAIKRSFHKTKMTLLKRTSIAKTNIHLYVL